MRSRIYWGSVAHWRGAPRNHSFRYPIYTFGLDLSELMKLNRFGRILGYNRWGIFSIRDSDYLGEVNVPLQEKLNKFFVNEGITPPATTTLFTMPRYFGYVFNPVSFFVSRSIDSSIHSLVVEVNNTFRETHWYLLDNGKSSGGLPAIFRFPKEFFVSPFFDSTGEYEICVNACDEKFDMQIHLYRDGILSFAGTLQGNGEPMTFSRLLKTLIRYPITSLLTSPRIHIQALKLYRRAKAVVYRKPNPQTRSTIKSRGNWIHGLRLWLLSTLPRREDD